MSKELSIIRYYVVEKNPIIVIIRQREREHRIFSFDDDR